jgi:two-component system sensor histidine kinase CiaH
MFKSARLKLTAWYLLIIMLISISFSIAIYKILSSEFTRGFERFHHLYYTQKNTYFSRNLPPPPPSLLEQKYIQDSKERVRLILLEINLIILGISGVAGYFLAGRTLRPIKVMVDEQNRFVTDASHEFRTPLTALKTSIEVYLRDKKHDTKKADDLIKTSLVEVNNLELLSESLISLAQYDKNYSSGTFETVSLQKAINEACKKVSPLAKKKNIMLRNKTEEYFVKGDYSSFVELFTIFLDNAIKYSPQKSNINIAIKPKDGFVTVEISDEGFGISTEDIPHIFNRFYRVDRSRSKQKAKGYGLGLAIAKRLVNVYKGSIDVSSEVSKGTTFFITFPKA